MSFRKYSMLILGAAVMAVSLDLFLIPTGIAPGGVSGLATVFGYFADFPVGIMIFFINIPIFIWGMIEFDLKFILSSMIGTLALSGFTELFAPFLSQITDNEILNSLFGGAILGLGMGIALLSSATTGGTDIIAKILKRRFPYFSIGIFILIIDAAVVAFASAVSGKWETMLYSGLALYISTKVVDGVIGGINYAKMAFIISDFPDRITEEISKQIGRGSTDISGYSRYTKKDKNIVMCVVRRGEIVRLKEIVKEIDKSSFVIIADVKEVQGEGFVGS